MEMVEMEMKNMIRRLMIEKISQGEGGGGDVKENIKVFILQTLTLVLHFFDKVGDFFNKKLDEFFPPETRAETLKQWLHVGLTIVLPIVLTLLVLYYCCSRCCCSGVSTKMMKAPGRKGALIARHSFEANPQGYFQNLRGKKSDYVF
ncbi:hypothetical protein J5N97_024727 [Dioscorea zingiberensis]|uniref:Uncharacterized protein n=1 Tax=Dioscorea zingiberensis TaxID=325984 RepID=A0A9D5C7X7_9LILI|nr:hypothetical protein J5N97_024727 [Dioscorea zingiberensis]